MFGSSDICGPSCATLGAHYWLVFRRFFLAFSIIEDVKTKYAFTRTRNDPVLFFALLGYQLLFAARHHPCADHETRF